ncbi:SsgA family sporulation/cell division regulator [Kitasatospora sp. NPDC054939]
MSSEEHPRVPAQRTSAGGSVMPLDLWAVVAPGLSVLVRARLRYDPAEPYAVFLDCHTDLGRPITWTFARDLLAAGTKGRSGTGSVRIHPAADGGSEALLISLTGEGQTVVLRAPTARVLAFLADTERVVPFGREHGRLDLDGLLRRLCGHELPEAES